LVSSGLFSSKDIFLSDITVGCCGLKLNLNVFGAGKADFYSSGLASKFELIFSFSLSHSFDLAGL